MSRIPVVDFKTMEQVLVRLGFQPIRQKGSHVFYRHPDGRSTTLPKHPGRDLARPLVREILHEVDLILHEIDLTPEQFTEELPMRPSAHQ